MIRKEILEDVHQNDLRLEIKFKRLGVLLMVDDDEFESNCSEELEEWIVSKIKEVNPTFEPTDGFESITNQAIEYMAKNHHPHTMLEVDSTKAILWEGQRVNNTNKYLVD